MKILKLLLIILFVVSFFVAGKAQAQDKEVKLQVQVLERKATDTINDFIWDGHADLSLKPTPLKTVLGASTTNLDIVDKPSSSESVKKQSNNLPLFFRVYLYYYLVCFFY